MLGACMERASVVKRFIARFICVCAINLVSFVASLLVALFALPSGAPVFAVIMRYEELCVFI
jgi:hypothetical protein